ARPKTAGHATRQLGDVAERAGVRPQPGPDLEREVPAVGEPDGEDLAQGGVVPRAVADVPRCQLGRWGAQLPVGRGHARRPYLIRRPRPAGTFPVDGAGI